MRRGYMAFAWDVPNRQRGTVDAPIDRHPHAREKMAVREGGREAITHWEIQEAFNGRDGKPVAALLACQLETGRTHQIRVHLSHIGHPLMGDGVYGPHFKTKASRLGPAEPGGPDRPRPPSATRIPPGAGAPQNRGDFALGGGFAGGFASPAKRAESGAMTQAIWESLAMPTGYGSHTGT